MAPVLALVWAAAPAPLPHTFAIVAANNLSYVPGRARLAYADDDAVKYVTFLSLFADPADVALLAELDADTRGLFPDLSARPPTVGEVGLAVTETAAKVRAARARGERTEVYFFFAGHGDVSEGRGFLELGDGPLSSDRLRELLRELSADAVHVVLDSCNSFFVVAPRKPGGRRFATPDDVARLLAAQLPNVGVVLSTSAESEVYEWSALQSGIFSHLVRSGASGAADADDDGTTTYEELAAFISVSSRSIENPLFRPKVFVRGPGGANSPLFRPRRGGGLRLLVDEASGLRVTIRDHRGLRWVDAHSESGAPLNVWIPWSVAKGMEVDRQVAGEAVVHLTGPADPPPELSMSRLSKGTVDSRTRGTPQQLERLFHEPFGPRAMADYQVRQAEEPPLVFGVSRTDRQRLGTMVDAFARVESDKRLTGWLGYGATELSRSGERGGGHPSRIAGPALVEGGPGGSQSGHRIGHRLFRLVPPGRPGRARRTGPPAG